MIISCGKKDLSWAGFDRLRRRFAQDLSSRPRVIGEMGSLRGPKASGGEGRAGDKVPEVSVVEKGVGNSQAFGLELRFPVIEDQPSGGPGKTEGLEMFESPEEVPGEGFGGLDSDGKNPPTLPDQKVDLVPLGVPVEKEVGSSPPVDGPFRDLSDHQVFIQASPQGSRLT